MWPAGSFGGAGGDPDADRAGDLIQAAIYAIKFGMATEQVAGTWAPYLTFAERLQALKVWAAKCDVAKLSCCAS